MRNSNNKRTFGKVFTSAITLIVPVFLLFFGNVTAAKAATTSSSLQTYYDTYYSKYSSFTQPVAPPAAPQPAPAPQPTTPPASTTTPSAPENPQATSDLSANEKLMFDLVNQERLKAGLPAYTVDMRLVNLARLKSQDMIQYNYFDHTSPTYGTPYEMEKKAGIVARVMGAENIAKAATTERAQALFMASSGHKANILNPLHDAIGIGIVETPSGVVVTQLFIGD